MDRGAHFFRCDFQVHSPRDPQWRGAECVAKQERELYAAELIKACRDKDLSALAITDHHDFCFFPFVREAARNERDESGNLIAAEKQIVVFPGLELTLGVPCQALLLFDANLPDDLLPLVLTALAITPSETSASRVADILRLDNITTLVMLRDELDKHAYLRGRYIILPNVSEGGTDTLLRSGAGGKYAAMPCVGGYIDGDVKQLGKGNRDIIAGKASAYGNKRIALFQTSDNRRADHAELGKHSTWVKWAVPSAEALRQACLAQESRISQAPPSLPSVAITALDVSNSQFLGPVHLELNQQYNALIGGRGTGKSTLLEYLRWALCDQLPSAAADDDLPNYQLRRRTLIEKTLQTVNATVQVSFTVNGIPHVVRRNSTSDELTLKVGDGEFAPCNESDVRSLLPIHAYSQKQLSNVSVRLEELSRFVEAPIRGELDDLEKRFERAASEMREIYATLLRLRRLQRQAANDTLILESLSEQAEQIRKSLLGLSEDDTKLLAAKPQYDRAEELIELWSSDLDVAADAIEELDASLANLPSDSPKLTGLPEAELLAHFRDQSKEFISGVKKGVGDLKKLSGSYLTKDRGLAGALKSDLAKWQKAAANFNERYEEAKQRATAHATQLEQLAQIEKRIAEVRATLAKTRRDITALGKPETKYSEVRAEWINTKVARARAIEQQCKKLTERSSGEIRASVHVGAGTDAIFERLRSVTAGSNLRREKLETIVGSIADAAHPDEHWLAMLNELETLASYDADQHGQKNVPKCPTLSACGLGATDLFRVAAKLNEDSWLELSLTRLEDEPVFEFRARENDYIPFANASAGQQATALLKALLNQPGPPLIIDQPEEDLDNPVILEVVGQIWKAKRERQLILASHNANLVVNGDAELVVWCDYRVSGDHSGGQIRASGAIDMPDICDAIKQVMEGGESAFKLRKEKYGF
jgi:type III restriction enzyme